MGYPDSSCPPCPPGCNVSSATSTARRWDILIPPVRLVPLAAMFPPSCLNLLFQLVWHLGMLHHLCNVVIRLWLPPKHLVQLDNQAWLSVEISKELCLRARSVIRKVNPFLSRNSTPL